MADGTDRSTGTRAARVLGCLLLSASMACAQDAAKGGIRGVISDADFNVPVPQVRVSVPEIGRTTATGNDGHYTISDVAPGVYTVVFAKEGFQRETRINVLVVVGTFAEVDTRLFGEYTDMEELVVSDIDLGGGTDAGLLTIKQTAATMMDSVGADMIGRAQRSTAADAIKLVTGASVEGGKYAVIRGLGDRYTSTQINAVRLPSADPDKRAVQLDQFPSAAIESIQVSKTFMPDQQGDSGAGTINIVTRSVPQQSVLSFKIGASYKPTITGNPDFRWNPRETGYWGQDQRDLGTRSGYLGRDPTDYSRNWQNDPAILAILIQQSKTLDTRVGTTTQAPPMDHNWGITVGDVYKLGEEWSVGGLGSFSYSRKYEGYNGGLINNERQLDDGTYYVNPWPRTVSLGVQKILWGGMATVGLRKGDEQDVGLTFVGNHASDSYAQETIMDNPDERAGPTGSPDVHRTGPVTTRGYQEVLDYLERDFYSVQEHGHNTLAFFENWNAIPGVLSLQAPVFEWTFAQSDSYFYEPDRTTTYAQYNLQGQSWATMPVPIPPSLCERDWYTIDEQSRQMSFSLKQPFENWTGDKGCFKTGFFADFSTADLISPLASIIFSIKFIPSCPTNFWS